MREKSLLNVTLNSTGEGGREEEHDLALWTQKDGEKGKRSREAASFLSTFLMYSSRYAVTRKGSICVDCRDGTKIIGV